MTFRMTPQRMAILGYLSENRDHPSAEDIFRAVLQDFPTMSLATVYNTLELLRKRRKHWKKPTRILESP